MRKNDRTMKRSKVSVLNTPTPGAIWETLNSNCDGSRPGTGITFDIGKHGGPCVITGDLEVTGVLELLERLAFDEKVTLVGMNMCPETVQVLHSTARAQLRYRRMPAFLKRQLFRVFHVLSKAVATGKETIYAEQGPDLDCTLRHELMHTAQRKLGKWGTCFHHVSSQVFLSNPIAGKARAHLVKEFHYRNHLIHIITSEIGARLSEGKVGWRILGLSDAEAVTLCRWYLLLMERQHGRGSVVRIRELAPLFQMAA